MAVGVVAVTAVVASLLLVRQKQVRPAGEPAVTDAGKAPASGTLDAIRAAGF